MVDLFYEAQDRLSNDEYKQVKYREFNELIDGGRAVYGQGNEVVRTAGLIGTVQKTATKRSEFDQKYVPAVTNFLRCLFCGRHLEESRPFLGDLIWTRDNDGQPAMKPLDYENNPQGAYHLLMWVYEQAKRYQGIPEISNLFVNKDVFSAPSSSNFDVSGKAPHEEAPKANAPEHNPPEKTSNQAGTER